MPRINLEDSLFKDNRFYELMIKTGSYRNALGELMAAWIQAQIYWLPEKKPIPKDVFQQQNLSPFLIESGLAEERPEGIYMRGSEEQFAWWFEGMDQRKRAGQRSAKRPRDAKGRLLPSDKSVKNTHAQSVNCPTEVQRPLDKTSNESNELQPSSSSSYKELNTLSCAGRAHDDTNETVYQSYPPRRGDRAKTKALGVLSKIPPSEIGAVMRGVSNFRAWCDANGKTGTEFVPMMSTWLNQRRWLDWQDPPTYGNTTVPIPVETAEEGAVEAGKKLEEQFPEAFARVRSKLAASEPRGAQ